jgi:eukaryotic-like serine/threonine-protein kinase
MAEPAKYRILHELGAGGMGTVFKGLLIGQAGFQRPIVIKQIKNSSDPGHLHLFVEEARRYAVLDHENIGRIFDFDEVNGERCMILEYIDGWSLVDYLERHHEAGRLPDVDLSVFIVSRVCRALQYVFEKAAIVHRDISPSNIMMTREGTVKLIDFGIATRSGTRDSSLTGKPSYMAPEMVMEMRADNRSDLFSLGSVLFEMLTGRRLFQGKSTGAVLEQVLVGRVPSAREWNKDVPAGVLQILRRALQREAAKRYTSAAEMGEACEHFLYDKGYGPTNLTLKQYVHDLFPHLEPLPDSRGAATFPVIEPTLLPISGPRDAATMGLPPSRGGGGTMVSPAAPKYTRVITVRPAPTVRPAATVRPAPTLSSAKTQPPPPRTERPAARTVPPVRKATSPVASARTTARGRKAKRQRRRR